jgi:ERCC4-type nuclease
MSLFKGWKPKGTISPYIRYYLKDSKAFIGKYKGVLRVTGPDNHGIMLIENILNDHNVILAELGLTQLGEKLESLNLLIEAGGYHEPQHSRGNVTYFNRARNEIHEINNKKPSELYFESTFLDVGTAPFKQSTINNCAIEIDSREPEEMFDIFLDSKFYSGSVTRKSLKLGDIRVYHKQTGDILLIERKTINDFKQSIISAHAHDQAERYYDETQELNRNGIRMKTIWIVEGQDNGERALYNALPAIQNVDGMVAYLTGILDQPVITSFSLNHTVYLTLKLIQCFFERELFYKLKTNAPLANRKKTERMATQTAAAETNSDHGVTRAKNDLASMLSYIPSIKKNVAVELANTGRSYREIICMSLDEIHSIKGVGAKSAQEIYADFNKL